MWEWPCCPSSQHASGPGRLQLQRSNWQSLLRQATTPNKQDTSRCMPPSVPHLTSSAQQKTWQWNTEHTHTQFQWLESNMVKRPREVQTMPHKQININKPSKKNNMKKYQQKTCHHRLGLRFVKQLQAFRWKCSQNARSINTDKPERFRVLG